MDLRKVDRVTLKSIIKEILNEDTDIFKDVIKEILEESQIIISKKQATRRAKLEQLISEDFDRHDDTFKALA